MNMVLIYYNVFLQYSEGIIVSCLVELEILYEYYYQNVFKYLLWTPNSYRMCCTQVLKAFAHF